MNALFFAQNKPILEDMKIIDIPFIRWDAPLFIENRTLVDLDLPPDYDNWTSLVQDVYKDAWVYTTTEGMKFRISKVMIRVLHPDYEVLFPVILTKVANDTQIPTIIQARGNINTLSGNGGAYQAKLNIEEGEGKVQFFQVNN